MTYKVSHAQALNYLLSNLASKLLLPATNNGDRLIPLRKEFYFTFPKSWGFSISNLSCARGCLCPVLQMGKQGDRVNGDLFLQSYSKTLSKRNLTLPLSRAWWRPLALGQHWQKKGLGVHLESVQAARDSRGAAFVLATVSHVSSITLILHSTDHDFYSLAESGLLSYRNRKWMSYSWTQEKRKFISQNIILQAITSHLWHK
jgi:hypothetical protein